MSYFTGKVVAFKHTLPRLTVYFDIRPLSIPPTKNSPLGFPCSALLTFSSGIPDLSLPTISFSPAFPPVLKKI